MNKEVLNRDKMTEEGRLKIKNIKKNKLYLSMINVAELCMAFFGCLTFIEGLDIIYNVVGNNTSEDGRLYNSILSLFAFLMSYLFFVEVKRLHLDKVKLKEVIKKIQDEIDTLKKLEIIENSNNNDDCYNEKDNIITM